MANLKIDNADGVPHWIKASGAGTDLDPHIAHQSVEDGVPCEYSKQTASGRTFLIQKGQPNNLRLRPQVLNEHAESSRVAQTVVTASSIAGQFFRASQDNINGAGLSVESAAGVVLDDFESYVNDAALQSVWVGTGDLADVETSVVYEGAQAMYMPMGAGSLGDEWANTFATADMTGVTVQFQMRSNKEYKDTQMRFFVEDSLGNTNSRQIVQSNKEVWTKLVVSVDALTADGGTPADITDIVKVGYRVEKEKNDGFMIVDILLSVPPVGSFKVKLWDMGATLPVSGAMALTDGTQYEKLGDLGISGNQVSELEVELLGGKRFYHINDFIAGVAKEIPGNEILNVDNYYALTIHHVDTDITVYGPNHTWVDYYNNGYGFTTPDEATNITALGSQRDLTFLIYSTQDSYITEMTSFFNAAPNGNSEITLYIEDLNMVRSDVLLAPVKAIQAATQTLTLPFFIQQGGKFEVEYNDDITDSVSSSSLIFQYRFIPPAVHG